MPGRAGASAVGGRISGGAASAALAARRSVEPGLAVIFVLSFPQYGCDSVAGSGREVRPRATCRHDGTGSGDRGHARAPAAPSGACSTATNPARAPHVATLREAAPCPAARRSQPATTTVGKGTGGGGGGGNPSLAAPLAATTYSTSSTWGTLQRPSRGEGSGPSPQQSTPTGNHAAGSRSW
nr:PhF00046.1 [Neoporphyra haitanensis]